MLLIKKEDKTEIEGFSDLLDYYGLIEDGIAILRSGSFLAAWEFVGPDTDSQTIPENFYLANRIANQINLGADFGVSCDLIRVPSTAYCPDAAWPDPVSMLIDRDRQVQFTTEGNYWKTKTYFALTYRPLTDETKKKFVNWIFHDKNEEGGFAERALLRFKSRVEMLESALRNNAQVVRRLKTYQRDEIIYDELFEYIQYCVNESEERFPLPSLDEAVFLNQYLCDDFLGGSYPKIGDKLIATIAINGFPRSSFAGIFAGLRNLPFRYRFSQQSEILGTQQAIDLHDKNSHLWASKETGFFKKYWGDKQIQDHKAHKNKNESDRAKESAEYRETIDAFYTCKIIIMDTDPVQLKEKVDFVLNEAIQPFNGRYETQNAVAAYISSLPGQMMYDKRQNLITTQNLAHFFPIGSPFLGYATNPSSFLPKRTPPLMYAATAGATPYCFHCHTSDVGHVLIGGPIGSGKTMLLQHIIPQWFRYPNTQVFAFDKKKTLYTLTKAMGGSYFDLNLNSKLKLMPLQHIDTPEDIEWAAGWIADRCEELNLKMTASKRNSIVAALKDLRSSDQRTLHDFRSAVDDDDIKEVMKFYTVGHPGAILDGDEDDINISRFVVFEMDNLYRTNRYVMNAVLFYLFRRVQKKLSSKIPTLISVDEFREALEHPVAVKGFDDFLNEGRKLNTCVALALQDLERVIGSPLGPTILQQCQRRILLPNTQAKESTGRVAYEALGLNESDLDNIASAQPKRDYYDVDTIGHRRMISLDVGQVALAFAQSGDADREKVDQLIQQYPQTWQAEWCRLKGVDQAWCDLLEKWELSYNWKVM